jgi:hypothetical protein
MKSEMKAAGGWEGRRLALLHELYVRSMYLVNNSTWGSGEMDG